MPPYHGSPCVTRSTDTCARDLSIPTMANVYQPPSSRGRSHTENVKTKPQLGCRTKSDYTGSRSAGLVESPFSASDTSLRPASQDATASTPEISQWHEQRPESLARSWLTKSSMLLRRKNHKSNPKSLRTFEWLEDTDERGNSRNVQELSKRRRSKHSREQSIGYETMLKQSISDPYNFHHLTHTGSVQAKALQNADQNELVTEFSAIRASQAPHRELKGIKAETLNSSNDPYAGSQTDSPTTSFDSSTTPSSLSPTRSRDQNSDLSQTGAQNIRYSQSVDSFPRISLRSFSSPTPPISPPPRRSSRTPLTLLNDQVALAQQSPIAPLFSGLIRHPYSASGPTSPLLPDTLHQSDICNVGHALTTPDDTAFDLRSPQSSISSAGLADVPEEDEGPTWLRKSKNNARPSTANSAVRHAKSFPITVSSPHQIDRSSMTIPSSSPTKVNLGSDPTLPHSTNQIEEIPQKRISRRVSASQILIRDSWEEDVDYCYEHAAEADCAFDWDRVSVEDDQVSSATEVIDDIITDITSNYERIPDNVDNYSSTANESNMSSVQPSRRTSYGCAFLDYGRLIESEMDALSPYSLMSSAITVSGAATPSDSLTSLQVVNQSARTSQASMLFNFSPDAFQENFARNDPTKNHHHSIYRHHIGASLHREDSVRSHDSPPSTCNSQESMLPTRSNSINPRYEPSSSVSSLPELVHSKNRNEEFKFAADQLAEHIEGLNAINESSPPKNQIIPLRNTTSTSSIIPEDQQQLPPMSLISPLQYRRDRSQSDSTEPAPKEPSMGSISTDWNARKRSASGPAVVPIITRIRASYSLFPSVPTR